MTTRERPIGQVERELRERAATVEPEPGVYGCLRCGRTDGVQMFTVVIGRAEDLERQGGLNLMDGWMRDRAGHDLAGRLVCPCCSFRGCPHTKPWNCPTCGLPAEPAGSLPGGGPFTRCGFDGAHVPETAL